MPLNGRNYLQLAQFTVGVLPSRALGKGTRQDGEHGGEGGFRAIGMNVAQNNILLDGNDNSSRNSGGALGFQSQAVKPPVDAVSEHRAGHAYLPTVFHIPIQENLNTEFGIKGAFGDTLNDGKDNGFALFGPAGFAQVGPPGFWPNCNDLRNFMAADNLAIERGNTNLDRRLAWVTSARWGLPFGKGKGRLESGPASWILGGWQLGGIATFLSGAPQDYSIHVNSTNVGGANRGDVDGDANLPSDQRTIDRWFNTELVVRSAAGVFGNAGRNLIVGPGRSNLDVMVSRSFSMPWEGHSLQFRFESCNFTNTPFFGQPNTSVGTPGGGQINDADDPRRI